MKISIYTKGNWLLLKCLFPKGTISGAKGNEFVIYLDSESSEYERQITTIKKVSPYLAQVISSHADMNGIIFTWKG